MAETPPLESNFPASGNTEYWCYHCEKRVSIETIANLPDIICHECKNGFVESISPVSRPTSSPLRESSDEVDDPTFGAQFIQVLRVLSQTVREDHAPPPPPPPHNHSPEDDFLRIELNGWDNDEDDEDANGSEFLYEHNGNGEIGSVSEEDYNQDQQQRSDEEDLRRRRRDILRLRIRDFASRARSGRNRILDWAEILMGLEDNSIEFRLEMPESDRYIGNPDDYIVDTAGYEAMLQTLAESDGGGRRGAPPASKSAVSALPTVTIASEDEALVCAICKDIVSVGAKAKKLPCGHGYHGDCIVPWLDSRNSCPVCRFELPTDDPEYEEEKKTKKKVTASGGGSSSSGGDNSVSG